MVTRLSLPVIIGLFCCVFIGGCEEFAQEFNYGRDMMPTTSEQMHQELSGMYQLIRYQWFRSGNMDRIQIEHYPDVKGFLVMIQDEKTFHLTFTPPDSARTTYKEGNYEIFPTNGYQGTIKVTETDDMVRYYSYEWTGGGILELRGYSGRIMPTSTYTWEKIGG